MRVAVPARQRRTIFDITPMIDVVFNLVIFFLVASHFARNEASEPVQLPGASQASRTDENPQRLTVTVLADGTWSVKGVAVDITRVKQMIDEGHHDHPDLFAVHVRADRRATYAAVEPILEACAQRGVTQVAFKVIER